MYMYHHYGFWGFHGFSGFGWVVAVIAIIPFWKICTRIGHSPWLSLLMVVPLANLIFLYWLAFSAWPNQPGGTGPGTIGGAGFPPGPSAGPSSPGPSGPGAA